MSTPEIDASAGCLGGVADDDAGRITATDLNWLELDVRPIRDRTGVQATITLNRPDQLNALSPELIQELDNCLTMVESDSQIRILFLTGAGRAFSAGGDLKKNMTLQRDPLAFSQFVESTQRTFDRFQRMRIPVVALVNGVTAAGGLELLLRCDVAIAAQSARIGDGHLNFGQMGGGGVLTLLPRIIGITRSMELLMTGKLVSAEQAAEWGLVNDVVPDDMLMTAGIEMARQVAAKSPLAVANAKSVMWSVWSEEMSTAAGLRLEREVTSLYCLTSHDAPEGLRAFSEKRSPNFTGR